LSTLFSVKHIFKNPEQNRSFTADIPSCIIVLFSAGNVTVFPVPTANKSSRNHTAMDFQTGDDALPGMTSCYISTAYNEPSL